MDGMLVNNCEEREDPPSHNYDEMLESRLAERKIAFPLAGCSRVAHWPAGYLRYLSAGAWPISALSGKLYLTLDSHSGLPLEKPIFSLLEELRLISLISSPTTISKQASD
jgi:hypothetical protein